MSENKPSLYLLYYSDHNTLLPPSLLLSLSPSLPPLTLNLRISTDPCEAAVWYQRSSPHHKASDTRSLCTLQLLMQSSWHSCCHISIKTHKHTKTQLQYRSLCVWFSTSVCCVASSLSLWTKHWQQILKKPCELESRKRAGPVLDPDPVCVWVVTSC